MRRAAIGGMVLAVMGLAAGEAHAQRGRGAGPGEAGRHGWLSSYSQAKDQARRDGKPMMLVFRCVP